jgi:ABC-type transporter Mla MlaB component
MGVTIKHESNGQTAILTVEGNFNFEQQQAFVDAFRKLDPDLRHCVVDLRQARQIESTAIWALLELRSYYEHNPDNEISILYAPDGLIEEALHVVKLGKLFDLKAAPPPDTW